MALSRTQSTNRMLTAYITRQVLINGEVHKPGTLVEVDTTLFNDLIHSNKAVPAANKTKADENDAAANELRNEERIAAKKPAAGKKTAAKE